MMTYKPSGGGDCDYDDDDDDGDVEGIHPKYLRRFYL